MKNKSQMINDSDKNLGAIIADRNDIVTECKKQPYDINTYIKLSLEELERRIAEMKSELLEVVNQNKHNDFCTEKV